MSSKKFSVFQHSYRPVVLSKPIIQTLPHVSRLESHDKLLLSLDLFIDHAHSLLSSVFTQVMDVLQIGFRVFQRTVFGFFERKFGRC